MGSCASKSSSSSAVFPPPPQATAKKLQESEAREQALVIGNARLRAADEAAAKRQLEAEGREKILSAEVTEGLGTQIAKEREIAAHEAEHVTERATEREGGWALAKAALQLPDESSTEAMRLGGWSAAKAALQWSRSTAATAAAAAVGSVLPAPLSSRRSLLLQQLLLGRIGLADLDELQKASLNTIWLFQSRTFRDTTAERGASTFL